MPNAEEQLDQALALLKAELELKRSEKFRLFRPYAPQIEFCNLSADKREILFMAGNQTGKTRGGAYCATAHLTGLYPSWWRGRRFNHPVRAWAGGEGGKIVRDKIQAELTGGTPDDETWGYGLIPGPLLIGHTAGHGETGLLDSIRVRHSSGGTSWLGFKTYDQGRGKWQSDTLDFVWVDEEPPDDVYGEATTRLTGKGFIFVTCTPLQGKTEFIRRFTDPEKPGQLSARGVVRMGLRHAEHFTDDEKQVRLSGYKESERKARENGDPILERGPVWEGISEEDITVNLRLAQVPEHWVKLWGIDFGIGHPFAAVLIAWDRDSDVIYVIDCFKLAGATPLTHAARMKNIAAGVMVAWPHDGSDREKSTGITLAQAYRDQGLLMRPSHATHPDGGFSTEAGIDMILSRMKDGRFKVAAHLRDWFDEASTYHRDDNGQLVKVMDDIMSATRVAVMDRRFATRASIGSRVMQKTVAHRLAPGADDKHWGVD